MTDDIKALEQILAWTDCDQEDLHFVQSHLEAVSRNMTALRHELKTAEAERDRLRAALDEAVQKLSAKRDANPCSYGQYDNARY